jgi:Ni/Co efflux regulator RcnB
MRTRRAALAAMVTLAAALLVSSAAAKKDRAGEGPGFSDQERQAILDYYADPRHRGPGDRALPPGIAKKVARGGALPPGIAKRYLPRDLDTRLPPPPPGAERVVVGSDVLLVEIDTGFIFDVLKGVLGGR